MQAAAEGRLLEMFGTGTAAIAQPVGALLRANGDVLAAARGPEHPLSLAARVQRQLLDIQYAKVPHEWSVPVE